MTPSTPLLTRTTWLGSIRQSVGRALSSPGGAMAATSVSLKASSPARSEAGSLVAARAGAAAYSCPSPPNTTQSPAMTAKAPPPSTNACLRSMAE